MRSDLKYHVHYVENADGTRQQDPEGFYITFVEPGCMQCKEKFEQAKSLCGFCLNEIANKDYLKNDYHQTGKCKARFIFKMPEQSWRRPLPYPMPAMPDYSLKPFPQFSGDETEDLEAFKKWWGLDAGSIQRKIDALERENKKLRNQSKGRLKQ